MADKKAESHPSLWDQLPKAEQQRLQRMMANNRPEAASNGNKRPNGSFNLKGYVRCELSASDKEAYVQWEAQHSNVECYETLVKLADSGYLLKVGEQGTGFQASLSAHTTGKPWDGYVLVAHASHASRSVMLLVYKHSILMHDDWEAWIGDGGEDDFR